MFNISQTITKNVKPKRSRKKHIKKGNEENILQETMQENGKNVQTSIRKDAFKYMMNNRNKSIGSNSSGKEIIELSDNDAEYENREVLATRKKRFKKWADSKGAGKRKLQDEDRGIIIAEKLDKRAKRFKKLLGAEENLNNSVVINENSNCSNSKSDLNDCDSEEDIKSSVKPKRIIIDSDSDTCNEIVLVISDDEDTNQSKLESKSRQTGLLNFFEKSAENNTCKLRNRKKELPVEDKVKIKPKKVKKEWKMRIKLNLPDDENSKSNDREESLKKKNKRTESCTAFLNSGIPDRLKRNQEKQRSIQSLEVDLFPKISHVKQKPDSNQLDFLNLPAVDLNLIPVSSSLIVQRMEELNLIDRTISNQALPNINYGSPKKNFKKKSVLEQLKNENPNFPVYKSFRLLQEKIPNKKMKQLNHELWTDLYKPIKSIEIFANQFNVKKLRKWLDTWIEFSNEINAAKSKRKRRTSDSSSDFITDGDSSEYRNLPGNALILSGPNGSGKTCAVYAICNDLGVNVLEVHASSRRTGKKFLQDLQEATQSHQVNKNKVLSSFFDSKPEKDVTESKKLTLLLIEDVDIVFEQDENFLGALNQLLTISKRPIILTTSDPTCLHLRKFFDCYPCYNFARFPQRIVPWLQIIGIIEGVVLSRETLESLLSFNQGDIRKTLLELQYYVSSGGGELMEEKPLHTIELKKRNSLHGFWKNLPLHEANLEETANLIDFCAISDVFLREHLQEPLRSWQKPLRDSLALEEPKESRDKDFTEEWIDFFINSNSTEKITDSNKEKSLMKRHKVQDVFSPVIPLSNQLNHQSVYGDYLSTLRTVSRLEKIRSLTDTKRGNRFYNYLRGLGISYTENELEKASSIFLNEF